MNDLLRKFIEWSKLKLKIHTSPDIDFYFKEKQIWWTSIGQNIGDEQNGKNPNFERPVLILKKFNKNMFLGIPISTKIKEDKHKYIFRSNGNQFSANLSQIRIFSSKRLLRKVGILDTHEFNNIVEMHRKLV